MRHTTAHDTWSRGGAGRGRAGYGAKLLADRDLQRAPRVENKSGQGSLRVSRPSMTRRYSGWIRVMAVPEDSLSTVGAPPPGSLFRVAKNVGSAHTTI